MTENIMLQETEMMKTGVCNDCGVKTDGLKQCGHCRQWFCQKCRHSDERCEYCVDEPDWEEPNYEDDDDE